MGTVERIVNAERVENLISVFGSFDENIKRIEESLGVTIVNRGTELKVSGDEESADKAAFIFKEGGPDVAEFCRVQLGTRDIDPKRLRLSGPDDRGIFTLAFRTWRILFSRDGENILVHTVFSGYTPEELVPAAPDPYADKELHRRFNAVFNTAKQA